MVRDSRWPFWPMIALRSVELFFSVIVLGCSAYIISVFALWYAVMALVTALFTIIYFGINLFLLFSNLLLPLAIVIVDAFLLVFWLICIAGFGASGVLSSNCQISVEYYSYSFDYDFTGTLIPCEVAKATFGISFIIFLLFIGSLILSAMILHKNRKDLRGAKHNSGLTPDGEHQNVDMVGISVQHAGDLKQEYQQPQQPQYQQYPQAGVDYYQQQVVSPPQTPAPYTQVQSTGGFASPPPPPPPVIAQEMPGYHQQQHQ